MHDWVYPLICSMYAWFIVCLWMLLNCFVYNLVRSSFFTSFLHKILNSYRVIVLFKYNFLKYIWDIIFQNYMYFRSDLLSFFKVCFQLSIKPYNYCFMVWILIFHMYILLFDLWILFCNFLLFSMSFYMISMFISSMRG